MPFRPHVQVRVNGILGSPGSQWEIFSYGFNMVGTLSNSSSGSIPDGSFDRIGWTYAGLVAAVTAFHSGTYIAATARVTELAIAGRNATNHQPPGEQTTRVPVDIPGGGTFRYPGQVALKVSLSTGLRGRGSRGGFFMPCPTMVVNPNDGLIATQAAQDVADAASTMLTAVNAWAGNQPHPTGIAAPSVGIVSKSGSFDPVAIVRVGRALDTMRSRRNALHEAYVTSANAPTANV